MSEQVSRSRPATQRNGAASGTLVSSSVRRRSNLTAAFDLSQPTISHHLKVLRNAGLVESSRRGTWAYYRVVPEALGALAAALTP